MGLPMVEKETPDVVCWFGCGIKGGKGQGVRTPIYKDFKHAQTPSETVRR